MTVLLAAALAAAACSDATGPPTERDTTREMTVPDGALHGLHWVGTEAPREFTIVALPDDEGPADAVDVVIAEAPASAGQAPLDRYRVSFWATKGRSRSVQINYRDDRGVRPFLRFSVPRNALLRRPDGSRIRWGESVLITVTVDDTRIAAHFEPSGLQFNRWNRAWLRMWYGGADWDFNGDGAIDELDQEIERHRLRLWFQDEPGEPWYPLPARHSIRGKWFAAPLYHFSGGEISH
jgi:hypothetical protein